MLFFEIEYPCKMRMPGSMGDPILMSIFLGICTLCKPWEALVIGAVGAVIAALGDMLLWKIKIDDPVGVVPVHGACGIWGLLSVGEFTHYKSASILHLCLKLCRVYVQG